MSVGISLLRFLILFLNVFIIEARYNADRMGGEGRALANADIYIKGGGTWRSSMNMK